MRIFSASFVFAIAVKHAQELINNREQPGVKATVTVEPLTLQKLKQKHTELIEEDFNKNGTIDTWYADANNNGTGDTIYIDDDEDGFIEAIELDLNENNSSEIMLFDHDLDGRPDQKFIDREDQNVEPKWDAIAVDVDQDGTWDKVQDFPKS